MKVWRIVKVRHRNDAFEGEGARGYGGRFNQRGQRAVYASQTLSLAALETIAHTGVADTHLRFVKFAIELPDNAVRTYSVADLPAGWDERPPPAALQQWGSQRLNEHGILRLPSVIIPEEFNVVISPSHPTFARIALSRPEPFHWDRRLLK